MLAGGYGVIVDATFLRRADRARLGSLAAEAGLRALLIQCEAPPTVLRARIMKRQRAGDDASEAGTDVLAWQETRSESVTPDESFVVIRADTTEPNIVSDIVRKFA